MSADRFEEVKKVNWLYERMSETTPAGNAGKGPVSTLFWKFKYTGATIDCKAMEGTCPERELPGKDNGLR